MVARITVHVSMGISPHRVPFNNVAQYRPRQYGHFTAQGATQHCGPVLSLNPKPSTVNPKP